MTASLARGAAARGHDVSVVCFGAKSLGHSKEPIGVSVRRSAVSREVSSQPLGRAYCLDAIAEAKTSDIVHLHAPNLLAATLVVTLPRRVKLVVHWHSDVVNKGILGRAISPIENLQLRRADAIICTSEAYASASTRLARYKKKIHVIPIGVPDASTSVLASELPPHISSFIDQRKLVLGLGRLVPYKGFEHLIRSASSLQQNAAIVIVGDGPLRDQLSRLVTELGVGDRVLLAGRLDDLGLAAVFQRASVFTLPSVERSEAFGVVLIEAMSRGLPIVATNIVGSGVPWVNKAGVSGINVEPGNSRDLAVAINTTLSDDVLRQSFSVNSRNRYLSEFTEHLFVDRTMSLYESLP